MPKASSSRHVSKRRDSSSSLTKPQKRFTDKLHSILCSGKYTSIHWNKEGTAIVIEDPIKVATEVLPEFSTTKQFKSFSRQLHLYGFTRTTDGRKSKDLNGFTVFMHSMFRRDRPDLVSAIVRRQSSKKQYGLELLERNGKLVSHIHSKIHKRPKSDIHNKTPDFPPAPDPLPFVSLTTAGLHESTASGVPMTISSSLEAHQIAAPCIAPQPTPLTSTLEPASGIPQSNSVPTSEIPQEDLVAFSTPEAKNLLNILQNLVNHLPSAHADVFHFVRGSLQKTIDEMSNDPRNQKSNIVFNSAQQQQQHHHQWQRHQNENMSVDVLSTPDPSSTSFSPHSPIYARTGPNEHASHMFSSPQFVPVSRVITDPPLTPAVPICRPFMVDSFSAAVCPNTSMMSGPIITTPDSLSHLLAHQGVLEQQQNRYLNSRPLQSLTNGKMMEPPHGNGAANSSTSGPYAFSGIPHTQSNGMNQIHAPSHHTSTCAVGSGGGSGGTNSSNIASSPLGYGSGFTTSDSSPFAPMTSIQYPADSTLPCTATIDSVGGIISLNYPPPSLSSLTTVSIPTIQPVSVDSLSIGRVQPEVAGLTSASNISMGLVSATLTDTGFQIPAPAASSLSSAHVQSHGPNDMDSSMGWIMKESGQTTSINAHHFRNASTPAEIFANHRT